jgi:hypothetical protein
MKLNFTGGCPDDVRNMALFKQVTGAVQVGPKELSGILTVQDSVGRWRYMQITEYLTSKCDLATGTDPTNDVIHITITPGNSDQLNPPGGWREDLVEPFTINAGIDFTSFRVRNRNLEQKTSGVDPDDVYSPGVFNPACDGSAPASDCPSIGFTPVVENVEDLQIAYVFRDGQVWNTATAGFVLGTPGNVPVQLATATGVPVARDITNVRALRVSVIARSNPLDIGARQLSTGISPTPVPGGTTLREGLYRRPALEDHAEGPIDTVATGVFDRYRLTTTLVLRNRMLGF